MQCASPIIWTLSNCPNLILSDISEEQVLVQTLVQPLPCSALLAPWAPDRPHTLEWHFLSLAGELKLPLSLCCWSWESCLCWPGKDDNQCHIPPPSPPRELWWVVGSERLWSPDKVSAPKIEDPAGIYGRFRYLFDMEEWLIGCHGFGREPTMQVNMWTFTSHPP